MPQILSVSRRTDIPAFYGAWLVNRLRAGHLFVRQPYSGKMLRVSLEPQDLSAIVFWSKNYAPLLPRLDTIEQYSQNLFFHFTITANHELELNVPDYRETIRDYLFLAKRYGPERLVWRYDPICITDKLSFAVHEERFVQCAELLKGCAERCIISFAQPYKRALSNLRKYTDHTLVDVPVEKQREYAECLAARAEQYGISLFACCNDHLLSEKIKKASCIDGTRLSALFTVTVDTRPAATRKECACTRSIDIGAYDTCAHGCVYCYANSDKNRAGKAEKEHDPSWNSLTRDVDDHEVATGKSQQRLF
jgi:hypothetical protein